MRINRLLLCSNLLLNVRNNIAWTPEPFQSVPASIRSIQSAALQENGVRLGITSSGRLRHSILLARSDENDSDNDIEEEEYDGEETLSYAPTTEQDSYVSEAEEAQLANEVVTNLSMDSTDENGSIDLPTEISNSFLQYALSIIMGRAIPDARDGLKPVHRRILFAMDQLSLTPPMSHRKCARVVGEVLGKFHPHGDLAVYDALVRLAQDFSTHYPLIDGHGNFGSIDADPAAAMRYTECRLAPIAAKALLEDLNQDTVDFSANFDGNEVEPDVLPAQIPVLLMNGSAGIAVGMATNIPPHNLGELLRACQLLVNARLKSGYVSDNELLDCIPGPDFPTGATILGTDGARQLYKTGHGGVVIRAATRVESIATGRGGSSGSSSRSKTAIIVTELPYQVNKAALLEKMADLVNDKKLEGIADLRDESDRDGIRVVIELKRDADAAVVLNNLYKKTALQTTFSGNMLALMSPTSTSDSNTATNALVPQRFTLRQALDCFLDFRFETIRRRSRFRLRKVETRLNLVEGLLLALASVDQVIEIVRSAEDMASARVSVSEALGTNTEQTDAILKLQLGQLTRLNKGKLEAEQLELQTSQAALIALMEVDSNVYDVMLTDFARIAKDFGDERKTRIETDSTGVLDDIDLIRNSRSVIVVTRGGYIKRMPLKTFENQRRGTRGKRGTAADNTATTTTDSSTDPESTNTESQVAHCFTCHDHDTLLMVTDMGIAYGLRAYQVPIGSRTARGQPIPSVVPVSMSQGAITTILPVSEFADDKYIVLCTEQGWIKKTPLAAFSSMTSRGLVIASLAEGDRLHWCHHCKDGDDLLLGTRLGMATRFEAAKLRPTGRTSRGVRAMKLRPGDCIADLNVLRGSQSNQEEEATDSEMEEYALIVTANGFGKRVATSEFRAQSRGGVGSIAMQFKKGKSEDRVSCLRTVSATDEILVITAKGIMVRQQVSGIPSQGKRATGVTIQKLDEGDEITSVSIVPIVNKSNEDKLEETTSANGKVLVGELK